MSKPVRLLALLVAVVLVVVGMLTWLGGEDAEPVEFNGEVVTEDEEREPAELVGGGRAAGAANAAPDLDADEVVGEIETNERAAARTFDGWHVHVVRPNGQAVSEYILRYASLGPPTGAPDDPTNGLEYEEVMRRLQEVRVKDPDGRFHAKDVPEGDVVRYRVEPVDTEYPADGNVVAARGAAPTRIVLPIHGVIRGVVIGPTGRPDGAAIVRSSRWGAYTEHFVEDDGTFAIPGQGDADVSATSGDYLASEVRRAKYSVGEEADEPLVLELRPAGRLTGEVLDDEGRPRPGHVEIDAREDAIADRRPEPTTDDGTFEFQALEPGVYMVIARPGEEDENAFAFEDMEMEAVEIVAGETVHVVLGGKPAERVRLHGTVTVDGEPAPRVGVLAVAEGTRMVSSWEMTQTDEDGNYEIVLDGPGPHVVLVSRSGLGGIDLEYLFDVPAGPDHRFDIALPTASVAGTVIGIREHRATSPDARIDATVSLSPLGASFLGFGPGIQVEAAEDGTYLLDRVNPGTYEVRATVTGIGRSDTLVLGPVVVVEDGVALTGVDLEYALSGDIRVSVTNPAGSPVVGADVFCVDEQGRVAKINEAETTNDEGVAVIAALAPGTWFVMARAGDRITPASSPILVQSAEVTKVDLVLASMGSDLTVELDGDEVTGTVVRVFDAGGRDWSRLRTEADLEELVLEGFSSRRFRYGPLPPGRYTVQATLRGGRTIERKIEMDATSEQSVTLRL